MRKEVIKAYQDRTAELRKYSELMLNLVTPLQEVSKREGSQDKTTARNVLLLTL